MEEIYPVRRHHLQSPKVHAYQSFTVPQGLNQTQTALLQECFSSDICVFVWPDFDLTDYWILISNLEAQPLQLGELAPFFSHLALLNNFGSRKKVLTTGQMIRPVAIAL